MTRPADRHPEAAWQTLRDPDSSERAVRNARQTLGLRDDEFAVIMRRAHVRPDDKPDLRPFAWCLIGAAVVLVVVVSWAAAALAERGMTEVNRIVLEAQE